MTGAAVLLIAVVVVFLANRIRDDGEVTAVEMPLTSATTAGTVSAASSESESAPLTVDSVSASSSFSDSLGPENLVDNDPSSYWNDASQHGEDAELIFEFSTPVSIERVVIRNLAGESVFKRNYRIHGYEITTDDLPTPLAGELVDTQDAQTIDVVTSSTTRLVVRVTSTYPAEMVGSQAPFEVLAVAEVTIFGRSGE